VSVSVSVFEFVFEGGSRLVALRLALGEAGKGVTPRHGADRTSRRCEPTERTETPPQMIV